MDGGLHKEEETFSLFKIDFLIQTLFTYHFLLARPEFFHPSLVLVNISRRYAGLALGKSFNKIPHRYWKVDIFFFDLFYFFWTPSGYFPPHGHE